jgi:hypothetical protein
MIFKEPIVIDILSFIKTGRFDCIKLGQTKEWINNNFPDPDDAYTDYFTSSIWHYGNIEFHFNNRGELFLICSECNDVLTGGDNLVLNKWIFDKPEELTIQATTKYLAQEKTGYTFRTRTLSSGFISAEIDILESGVKMGFSLPDKGEDINQFLARLENVDVNYFQLVSISLMSR